MFVSKLNLKHFLLGLAGAMLLCHCGQNPAALADAQAQQEGTNGVVKSTIVLGKVGVLSKSSTISLKKLVLMAVSSATPADTVSDTSFVTGSNALTVLRTLSLKPLRNWTVNAKTLDLNDSVIHNGASSSFFVKPADTAEVSLNLASRFTMYQATFSSLPDSIRSPQTGTGKDKLNLNRVVLKIDGVQRSDSSMNNAFFPGNQSVNLYFDYITPGTHTVTLEAYGTMHTYNGILFTGSSTFTVTAGNDDTKSISLDWVGPNTGTGKITVILGRVGQVVVNGGINPSIFF